MTWPKTLGNYKLHKSSEAYAFYFRQAGCFSFYYAIEVQILSWEHNKSLTIVEAAHLSGNKFGSRCVESDPLTFNWVLINNDYYRTIGEFLSMSRPMDDRQIEKWMRQSKKRDYLI